MVTRQLQPPWIFTALMIAQVKRRYGKYRHRHHPQDISPALLASRDDKQDNQKSSKTHRHRSQGQLRRRRTFHHRGVEMKDRRQAAHDVG